MRANPRLEIIIYSTYLGVTHLKARSDKKRMNKNTSKNMHVPVFLNFFTAVKDPACACVSSRLICLFTVKSSKPNKLPYIIFVCVVSICYLQVFMLPSEREFKKLS